LHTVNLEVEWDSLAAVADMCERCLDNFHWVSAGLALANAQGLTIDVIYVGVDGGWAQIMWTQFCSVTYR